jgi:hypothetical protein
METVILSPPGILASELLYSVGERMISKFQKIPSNSPLAKDEVVPPFGKGGLRGI